MADRICLRLRRNDMNVFSTIDEPGRRPIVHVAGRHPVALCPRCARPSGTTNGCGWRDVIDVVRTVVITLSVCVRRFLCEEEDCPQRSFDERFEGVDRGGASSRALAFFADLARGRATRAVARDVGVPEHYLRMAVGAKRRAAYERRRGRLGPPPGHRRVQREKELRVRHRVQRPGPRRGHRSGSGTRRGGRAVLRRPLQPRRASRSTRRHHRLPRPLPGRGPGDVPQRLDRGRRLPPAPTGAVGPHRGPSTPGTAGATAARAWASRSRTPASPWPDPATRWWPMRAE